MHKTREKQIVVRCGHGSRRLNAAIGSCIVSIRYTQGTPERVRYQRMMGRRLE